MQRSIWLAGLLLTICSPYTISRSMQPPLAKEAGWQYEQTVESTGGTTYKANLKSTNLIELAYPYGGGSTVTLTIRTRNGTTTAYLSVTKGLLTSSYQGGKAQIRSDTGKPVTYSMSAAANGRGNVAFFDDSDRFIRQLKSAKSMSVQLTLANQPLNPVQFNTGGLRWDH